MEIIDLLLYFLETKDRGHTCNKDDMILGFDQTLFLVKNKGLCRSKLKGFEEVYLI